MSSNYQENSTDTDLTYISANDTNFSPFERLNVPIRKTVIFGQNVLTNVYPLGNFGKAFQPASSGASSSVANIVLPKIDKDSVDVLAALPTAIIFSNRSTGQTMIRGSFNLLENTPQTNNFQYPLLDQSIPVQTAGYEVWSYISCGFNGHSVGILPSGTLWTWGNNSFGQLGTSNLTHRSNPGQILPNFWFQASSGSAHATAIRADGTLWTWGGNTYGQLGDYSLTTRSSPVQVSFNDPNSTFIRLANGNSHSAVIQTNGILWLWGLNSFGQLGTSSATNWSYPQQIGSNLYQQVACGDYHTLAIQSNGTLWAWGNNSYGQLGASNLTHRYSPLQIGSQLWKQISGGTYYSAAVRSDGTLWTWGYNNFGQLGVSNITNRSSPVQVGSLLWKQVACGADHTIAIQSNGTLWTWGNNSYGQLGVSDLTHRSSPIQVGIERWAQLPDRSGPFSAAIRSDGTLWAWGNNSFGGLGIFENTLLFNKISWGI